MKRYTPALALVGLLAACGGDGTNPFDDGSTGDTDDSEIPESLAGDLDSFSYDADNQTLTVTGLTQDSSPVTTTYTRNPSLDTAGYEAYTVQDDALFRHAIALVAESENSGSVRAGVVSTGGQFNRIHNGGYYERSGSYNHRTTGHVRYAGTYAGITNVQATPGGDLLDPGNAPDELVPGQGTRTRGNIAINADFNDGDVEGAIYDRVLVDTGDALPSIVLVSGDIADDGTFFGSVVQFDDDDGDIGDYGGIFGGPDAESMGGVVNLEEWDDGTLTDEVETGVFVLESCESADQTSDLCTPPVP